MNRNISAFTILASVFYIACIVNACPSSPAVIPSANIEQTNQSNDQNSKGNRNEDTEAKGGDPVSLRSGAHNLSAQDLSIEGRALDVTIRRQYCSFPGRGTVYFDGSESTEKEGVTILGYQWTFPDEAYDIHGANTLTADCKFPPGGPYEVCFEIAYKDCRCTPKPTCCQYGRAVEYYDVYVDESNFGFGHGWDLNYNIRVTGSSPKILLNGENRWLEYTHDPNSDPNEPGYFGPAGSYDYLIKHQDGKYTLHRKHKTKWYFNSAGNITEIKDRNGNQIAFEHTDCNLTTITDDLGRKINFTYDPNNGLLTDINDFAGRSWSYTYDGNNCLSTVTTPATAEHPNGLTATYAYDVNCHLSSITDANGQAWLENSYRIDDKVSSQTYGDGDYTFSYCYCPLGGSCDCNITMVKDRKGYYRKSVHNSTGNLLSQTIYIDWPTDQNGYTTSYGYNSDMEITRETFPAGNCMAYTYDANGNVLGIYRKTEPNDTNSSSDPNVLATTFTYDPNFDFVKTMTDPLGNVTTYDYNSINGNLEKISYPNVVTPDGNQIPVVSFTYNSYGQVTEVNSPDGIITKYEYYSNPSDANNNGRLWKITADYGDSPCLNITSTYKYDKLGHVIEVSDPNSDITKFAYNNLDQLTKITSPSPYNYVTNFTYDKCKMLSKVEREIVNDANQLTCYNYNVLDKLKKLTDPLGYVTKFEYDKNENLSDANDAEENNTKYEYDERDLLWKVTDAKGNVTEYSYTLNGDVNEVNDPNGDITKYAYDGFDRLTCITYPDDTNEVFGYDKNSNVTSYKNRDDKTTYYEYDALNRLTEKDPPGLTANDIIIRYDIAGRVYDVNDTRFASIGGGITRYYYDRIGRVNEVNDIGSRTVKYEYNNKGLRTKLTYPDDSNVTYEYDALSRLRKVKYNGAQIAEYQYDELSRRTLVTFGNDSNAVYDYDLGNRLTKLTNNIDESAAITFDYSSYDKVGNRKSCKIDDADAHVYTYDEIYRLTFVDYNDSNTTSYAYDSLGNRTSVTNGGTIYYYRNSLNQYTSVGGTTCSYDDNGNLTDDGTYKYSYDCENRLTCVLSQIDLPIEQYSYDYLGRRIKKDISNPSPIGMVHYCYDGDQVIAQYEDILLARKFIYGPGIDEPICMIVVDGGETKYYYHFDGLGSVVALSNNDGDIVERYSYDVFGEPNRVSNVGNPYLFTGRRYDSEAGLYYYRARYYRPSIGRFIQTDPIRYAAGLNLYTYVNNNPINYIDPLGLWSRNNRGGHHWNLQDTQSYIDRATRAYNWSPFEHKEHGRYDFGYNRHRDDTFAIPKQNGEKGSDIIDAGDFGNYFAGYMGAYKGGMPGYFCARAGGNLYENYEPPWDVPSYFHGDTPDSIEYINRGANDAFKRLYKFRTFYEMNMGFP